jgi:hypothetical protein
MGGRLASTVVGSIGGGSAMIIQFGPQSWAHDPFDLVAMLGLVFDCSLLAWSVVRWVFNWIERRKDKHLAEVVQDARDAVAGMKNG